MSELDNEPALLFAYDVRGRTAKKIDWDVIKGEPPLALDEGGYRWIGLNREKDEARAWLSKQSGLPAIAAATLLAEETRPRALHMGKGLVVNLRGVNLNPGAEPEDMISVRLWLQPGLVISVQIRRLKSVYDARRLFDHLETTPETPGALLAALASKITDRMEPVIRNYAEMTDDIEELSLEGPQKEIRARLGDLRRDAIILRRYIAPQRDIINALSADQAAPLEERTRLELRETADRVTRLVEELDAVRDRASVVSDQMADQRAEEMNRNMLILSVVAAIFLPLSFVTGLLGVNLGGIPGAADPRAFSLLIILIVALAVGLVLYFKKKKWL